MKKITWMLFVSLWCVAAIAATRFERVSAQGSDIKTIVLAGTASGFPAELSLRPLADSKGNAVRWRVKRDETDRLGMRHLFYVQIISTTHGEAVVNGTEVGLHYGPDGTLRSIGGYQITSLSITNEARFGINAASERIVAAIRRSTPSPMTPGAIEALKNPVLVVVTEGGASRLAYDLVVEDGGGLPYRVAIDASSEEIVRIVPEFAGGNCAPTEPLQYYSATGIPLRAADGVPNRPLTANYTGGRPAPGSILTYEGYRLRESNSVSVLPLQQTIDLAFMCTPFSRSARPEEPRLSITSVTNGAGGRPE